MDRNEDEDIFKQSNNKATFYGINVCNIYPYNFCVCDGEMINKFK